jgi:anthranilate/para-aminobenzoate synthase component II
MLLIVTHEIPNQANKLRELYQTLKQREIPYIVTRQCDPAIIQRKDIRGLIIPGSRFRVKSHIPQPELKLELYYLFHFRKTPVLGICHGCQVLMLYYGGLLRTYNTLWKGEYDVDLSKHHLFKGHHQSSTHERAYFYFHDLPVAPPPSSSNIREIAWITNFRDGRRHACAFEFVKNRVFGVMFHPEGMPTTCDILYNFYDKIMSS